MTVTVTRTNWAMAQQIRVTGTVNVPSGSSEVVTVISGGPSSTTKVTPVTGPATPSLDVEHFAIRQTGVIDTNVAVVVRDVTTKVPSSVFTNVGTANAKPALGSALVGVNLRPDLYTSSTILNLLPAAQCVRIGIAWSTAQPISNTWDSTQLALYDAVFSDLATRNIKAQVTCGTTPAWARSGGTTFSPATNPADHAAFIQSIVSRWGASRILCVDPWNEPDLSFSGTAAQYVALLSATKSAVTAVPVCLGPFSLANITYLESLFTAGLTGSMFNWMDLHPYPFSHGSGVNRWVEPSSMPSAIEADGGVIPGIHKMESTLSAHSITNVPLIISEIGVATDPVDQSEPQMRLSGDDAASWLSRSLDLVRRLPSLQAVNVHQGRDINTTAGWTESFGLLDQNNNRRATWATVSAIVGVPVLFNPLTQVTPLYATWAGDPSWSAPADGGAVTSMRNQTGGTLTGTATMRSSVSQLNNRPAVEFNGTTDVLGLDVTDQAMPYKVLAVVRWITSTNTVNLFGLGGSAGHGLTRASTFWTINANSNSQSTVATNTAGHVVRANFVSAAVALWLDGTQIVAPTGSGTASLQFWRIGSGGIVSTASRFANCQIAFMGIYDGSTLDSDLVTLETALRTHYATP